MIYRSTYETQQPKITDCGTGRYIINFPAGEETRTDEHDITVTSYFYDTDDVWCGSESDVMNALKEKRIQELLRRDSSSEVNVFYFNRAGMWLDKATRVGLRNSITCEEELGKSTTTLWYGNTALTIPIATARELLAAVEVYALECYNVTARHRTNIACETSLERVFRYDITEGYPQPLSL